MVWRTVGVLFVATLVFQRVFATARSAAQFIDDPRSAAARGSMAEVKHQFGTLIRHATRDGRLVILVDDLDRCESARALEVCRVASQLLAHEGVVTILLADMTSISASASIRFAADNGSDSAEAIEVADDVGRRYLEKIVQIELALPPPDPVDMRAASSGYSDLLRASPSSADADDRSPKKAGLKALTRVASATGSRGFVAWQTVIRWVEQAKWWPALVGISAAFALVAALTPAEGDEYGPDWPVDVLVVTTLVTLAIGVWSSTLRRRHRRRRETYKRTIEELKDRTELSEKDIEAELLGNVQAVQPAAEHALVGDLVSSSFLDSTEFRAVERFVADHPRRLPREGKRMFNHAQLLTEIARARQMFGGDPPLNPEHLAKWVVLRERWPAIGRAVLLSPELLRDLEDAAAADRVEDRLNALALTPNDVGGLAALLICEPKLGALIERLIYFTPSARSSSAHGPSLAPSAASKRFKRRSAADTEFTRPRPPAT